MALACVHDNSRITYHDCQGADRRIHALVIGVGRYLDPDSRYGTRLQSLPGAAFAGYRFAHYLINEFQAQEPNGRRLATVRLLLSPLQRERAEMDQGLLYEPAERREAAVALQDWADDCDRDEQSLAVLYVAGHGVALGKSSSLLFLADAPAERSLSYGAINLAQTERLMGDCSARDNLFLYDCCAVPSNVVPNNQSRALSIDEFPSDQARKRRVSLLCINAARVGTKTFAIGRDGTLLSRSLLGEYQDRAGDDALLRIAGELVANAGFGITPNRLGSMLTPRLQEIARARNAPAEGYEATLTGKYSLDPITLPLPTPSFPVTLREVRRGRTGPIALSLLDFAGGQQPLTPDAKDVEVNVVAAGDYTLQITDAGGSPTFRKLQVTGPTELSVGL
jgi:hypothetical protein